MAVGELVIAPEGRERHGLAEARLLASPQSLGAYAHAMVADHSGESCLTVLARIRWLYSSFIFLQLLRRLVVS